MRKDRSGGYRLLLPAALCLAISACGGGGGDSAPPPTNQPPPAPPPAAVQDGAFKDSNVEGLAFVSGGQSGVTDAAGRYQCETGNTVTFTLGAVQLGTVDCSTLTSPPALIGDGTLDDPAAINMASFLLMLDSDEDSLNGISISQGIRDVADSWPAIDFTAADFSAELTVPLADIMSVEQRMAFDFSTTPTIVRDHLEQTLSCAYSGTFIGQLSGDSTAAVTVRVGRENFVSNADDVSWFAVDPALGDRSTFVAYDVAVPPSFDSAPVDNVVQVTGSFDTPDSISGTWNLPRDSLSGTYVVNRIGGDTAETRINGSFVTDDGGTGVTILDITGSQITGQAFEATEGTLFDITGTVDGDAVSITARSTDGEVIVGTGSVTRRDRFGLPNEVVGNLDVGGSFFGRGCRLN